MGWPSFGNAFGGGDSLVAVGFSDEGFGTAKLIAKVVPGSISEETFGTPVLSSEAVISPASFSDELFGIPNLTPENMIVPTGFSDEQFGVPVFHAVVSPVGSSDEAFGEPTFIAFIHPGSLDDSVVGSPTLVPGLVTVFPIGIPSEEAFGVPELIARPFVGRLLIPGHAPFYRIVMFDLADEPIEEVPFNDLEYSFVLNEAGVCTFKVPVLDPKATPEIFAPGKRGLRVFREGVPVWGGRLWFVGASTDQNDIRVQAEGWMSSLFRRHVDVKLTFENEDQVDILWDLIAWTQGRPDGALGISRGSTPATGITRTRSFKPWNRDNIGQVMLDMAAIRNGIDYEVTPDKVLNTYYPAKKEDNGVVFELGKNIDKLTSDIDAAELVTEMTGMGSGSDKLRCIVVVDDNAARAEYGLLQTTVDLSHIRHYDSLLDKTKEQLRLVKGAQWQPSLTVTLGDPAFSDLGVGDLARVRAKHGFIDINEKFRSVAHVMRLSNEGRETMDVIMDREVADLP